jgi:hypothetical protein
MLKSANPGWKSFTLRKMILRQNHGHRLIRMVLFGGHWYLVDTVGTAGLVTAVHYEGYSPKKAGAIYGGLITAHKITGAKRSAASRKLQGLSNPRRLPESVRSRIRKLRLVEKKTMAAVAEEIGVSISSVERISRARNGEREKA